MHRLLPLWPLGYPERGNHVGVQERVQQRNAEALQGLFALGLSCRPVVSMVAGVWCTIIEHILNIAFTPESTFRLYPAHMIHSLHTILTVRDPDNN